jgi:hypothetical protein
MINRFVLFDKSHQKNGWIKDPLIITDMKLLVFLAAILGIVVMRAFIKIWNYEQLVTTAS